MAAMLAASIGVASPVAAANGDNLASFDAEATAGIPSCGSGIGTGLAYDVTTDSLILSCWGSNVLERVDAVTHLNDGALTIAGVGDLGALAYDAGRNRVWACEGRDTVVLLDLSTSAVDPSVTAFTVSECVDGLAYDGSDDTIWVSPDVSGTVFHYSVAGVLLGSFPVILGGYGNSGIAVGGPLLYLANNGGSQIYTSPKDFSGSPTLFATFSARLEDLECDSETFAGAGTGAIWSNDAFDRILNAWEIPAGACASGGGGGGGGPTEHAGTVPEPFACGTYLRGGEDSGQQLNPADYSYTMPSPLGISGAGVFADHHWVHSTGTAFVVFDMGAPVPAAFYVPSIDHGPIPGEAMEATLYGTNNPADPEATWEAGTITDIYAQGVDAAWISDDFATRWTFTQPYRYIGIIHGGPGAIVDDGDAEIDAVCAEGTRVTATKFYDANANGVNDGEAGIAGWRISVDSSSALTDANGEAAFVLQAGAHTFSEGTPVQTNWFHTTPATVGIVVPADDAVSFGNVCVGAGGGYTLGFWSNKNGQAVLNDGGTMAPELALLTALHLRTATGANFDPTTYAQFRTWILSASATNMAYMLSAQLAAMALNVEAGSVSGSALIYAPGTTSANALGFATVNAVMAEANAALAADGSTPSGDPNRVIQTALKDALDRANNNTTFVQASACPFSF